jgi:hypothetical protein
VASIHSPAGVSEAFVAAIDAGDLPGALGLYRPGIRWCHLKRRSIGATW